MRVAPNIASQVFVKFVKSLSLKVRIEKLINFKSLRMSNIKIDASSFYSKLTKLYKTWKNPKDVS